MHRSKKVLVVSHCLLNANSKVTPIATYPGMLHEPLLPFIKSGVGLVQLPCPETIHLGMRRFGMTREQYDTLAFIDTCKTILMPTLYQLQAYHDAGYELLGVIGVNGSPSCGITQTCFGYTGGEISSTQSDIPAQVDNLRFAPGQGVFMEVLLRLMDDRGLSAPLMSINEECPTGIRIH